MSRHSKRIVSIIVSNYTVVRENHTMIISHSLYSL